VSWRDGVALVLVLTIMLLVGLNARHLFEPFTAVHQPPISLSPSALPGYALRTTLRMFAALAASLFFTLTYATLAAKNRRAGTVLIPLLDVLQSVPILGYLSFTVVFFVSLFPGKMLGPELAAVFAIFTSQAWNMTFSFYQSLRTVPTDLEEVSRSLRLTGWQRFWRLEVPFAMPGLVWNTMVSMSGGWFFVVASESIAVGALQIKLPGIGSYVATAIEDRNFGAIGWAILTMAIVILIYDQLFFRPLVAWADKYRVGTTAAQIVPRSWLLDLFKKARVVDELWSPIASALDRVGRARMVFAHRPTAVRGPRTPTRVVDVLWYLAVAALAAYLIWRLQEFAAGHIGWQDVRTVAAAGALTLLRVIVLIAIATVIWVPIGVAVGLRPKLAARVQPIAQLLASFPANLLFPIAVVAIVHFHLAPAIWLSPLMILGTQWYILFNVIAGSAAFPADLREAAASFRIHGWRWWRYVALPGIFPYYVTGAVTASGGAWNASIVAEVARWGSTTLDAGGLGSYIARMTTAGDFPRIALGIATMSFIVVCLNRLIWRPLYGYAERRTRLD
jgi:NitT/TauT family transport system permease protein